MSNAAQDVDTAAVATAVPTAGRKKVNEQDRAPLAITIRIFIYLVAVHFFAGFLFLLFYVAGAK
ncbi:hypothetical protein CTZ27_01840 [Streptomyces griseocarneus]|nr:hypothetical protein CTZ27_01840 [Streptomyces griseocarneus]